MYKYKVKWKQLTQYGVSELKEDNVAFRNPCTNVENHLTNALSRVHKIPKERILIENIQWL